MILLAISIIEKNLRLTVGKDFNESILVEKTITHRYNNHIYVNCG